jgi:hypothetical protein
MLGRCTLIVPVSEVDQVVPEQRRLIVGGSPRLVGSERLDD